MRLFPHKEFEIQSVYTKEVLTDRLKAHVLEDRDLGDTISGERPQLFKGEVYLDGFKIVPRGWHHGRHTQRPIISGTIIEDNGKTILKGQMKFKAFLKWFLIIMLIFFATVSVYLPDNAVIIMSCVIVINIVNLFCYHARVNSSADKSIEQLNIIAGHTIDVDDDRFDTIY